MNLWKKFFEHPKSIGQNSFTLSFSWKLVNMGLVKISVVYVLITKLDMKVFTKRSCHSVRLQMKHHTSLLWHFWNHCNKSLTHNWSKKMNCGSFQKLVKNILQIHLKWDVKHGMSDFQSIDVLIWDYLLSKWVSRCWSRYSWTLFVRKYINFWIFEKNFSNIQSP